MSSSLRTLYTHVDRLGVLILLHWIGIQGWYQIKEQKLLAIGTHMDYIK